jgi:hypothetical protein
MRIECGSFATNKVFANLTPCLRNQGGKRVRSG